MIWEHLKRHDLTALPCERNTLQVVVGLGAEKEKNEITPRSWRIFLAPHLKVISLGCEHNRASPSTPGGDIISVLRYCLLPHDYITGD